jgi:hypothetical protein
MSETSGVFCGLPLLRHSSFFVLPLESVARDVEAEKEEAGGVMQGHDDHVTCRTMSQHTPGH